MSRGPLGWRRGVRAVAAVVTAAVVSGVSGCSTGVNPPPSSLGNTENRSLQPAVATTPLYDQAGRKTDLAAFRGRIVMVVPFLTLCQEVCPITTGELLGVARSVSAAGLGKEVAIVELSVDPGRDTPERLAAYARLTGVSWTLLTTAPPVTAPGPAGQSPPASPALTEIDHFFGWLSQKTPEGSPAGTDWWTGRPLTYDVDHSDGFALLDRSGHVRFETGAGPTTGGKLSPSLSRMLDAQGRRNLASPAPGSWTLADALDAVSWLVGRRIPPR